jgi:gluconolactonase
MDQPQKIAGGYHATAGPVYSRRAYLLFSDVPSSRILKWERGDVTVFRENSHGATASTFDHQGRLLTCETGRVTRTEKDGKITVLASGVKEPADLVYAIDGSIYFSDPLAGIVYQITRKGDLRPVSRDCEHPFGVALAPNQQRLFATDRARREIRVYDVAGDGSLGAGKIFTTCEDQPGGLKTDEGGGVWLACSAGIRHFDRAGKQMEIIALSEPAGNCNWGEGFQDLYITAGTSVYRAHVSAKGTRTY